MEIVVGDTVAMQWTAPDLEAVCEVQIKVTKIQETPIKVLFGEQA